MQNKAFSTISAVYFTVYSSTAGGRRIQKTTRHLGLRQQAGFRSNSDRNTKNEGGYKIVDETVIFVQ